MKPILSKETIFQDPCFFHDDNEHYYDVECYDGHGIGTLVDEEDNAPKTIKVDYPTLKEVLADEEMSAYVLRYRGLYDLSAKDIRYDDIMLAFGEIID
jgi:hypothetical protein